MREIRRADERYSTTGDGVSTRHSFSYGAHYDADNVRFGPIIAINTEHLEPGRGYDAHHHADVEIVTWVLDGALRHEDSTGRHGTVLPGVAQWLSAGTGVEHTERNASETEPLTFVQMMLASTHDGEPAYEQVEVHTTHGLTPTIGVRAPAQLFVLRWDRADEVRIPAAPRSLVHVTSGVVTLGDTHLSAGDEARLTGEGEYALSASGAAEALIWQLQE